MVYLHSIDENKRWTKNKDTSVHVGEAGCKFGKKETENWRHSLNLNKKNIKKTHLG